MVERQPQIFLKGRDGDGVETCMGNMWKNEYYFLKNCDGSVGIALGYGLDDRGSIPGGCWEFFSSPPRPERF
jgi:hypothetical protein